MWVFLETVLVNIFLAIIGFLLTRIVVKFDILIGTMNEQHKKQTEHDLILQNMDERIKKLEDGKSN